MNVNKLKKNLTAALCYLLVVILLVILLLPIYHIFTMGFKSQVDAFANPPIWIFKGTFENMHKLFFEEEFARYLLNSFIVSMGCVCIGLTVGAMAGYALSRLRTKRWANVVLIVILAIRMLPPMSLLLPIFSVYVKIGLDDTFTGLIVLYLTFIIPLDVWMLKSFFDDVPLGIEEAAIIDGCGTFQAFYRISLPLISEALAATAIFSWVFSWNEFLFAMIVSRNNTRTAPVAVNNFLRFEDAEWGLIAASAVIISLPVIVFGILVRKYLVSGLTAGAIKE